MSTRRLFLPFASTGTAPTWIYGTHGGIGQMICFPSGSVVLANADQRWGTVPNIFRAYGPAGNTPATSDAVIMPANAAEAQALAMLLTAGGTIDAATLGTFLSPDDQGGTLNTLGTVAGVPQYAALLSGSCAAQVGAPAALQLLCGGFFSYYLDSAHAAHPAPQFGAVDLASGTLDSTFIPSVLTINASYTNPAPPKLFSDGAAAFGVYSLGLNQLTTFSVSFAAGAPAGTPTVLAVIHGTAITGPVATYGAAAINGPFFLTALGAFSAAFTSGIFSWAQPAPSAGSLFLQDMVVQRPTSDPTVTGALAEQQTTAIPVRSGATFQVHAVCNLTAGSGIFSVILEGGSTGDSFNSVFTFTTPGSVGPLVLAAVLTLCPECTGVVTADTTNTGTLNVTVTVTLPTGATYYPFLGGNYNWFGSPRVPQSLSAAAGGNPTNYLGLIQSNGTGQSYYILPVAKPNSTALAVNAGVTCHAASWLDPNSNVQWTITLPGVVRLNVSLAYSLGSTSQGSFILSSPSGDYSDCPVSVAAFGTGFAVALPYNPRYHGTGGAPLKYSVTPAKTGAAAAILFGPIFLISSAGAVSAAFDTAMQANFWALSRTDGRRYGPYALAVDPAARLRFGSYYIPAYFDPAQADPTPTDNLGNLTPVPVQSPLTGAGLGFTFSPFFLNQTGPGLEVFCCASQVGAKIFPV